MLYLKYVVEAAGLIIFIFPFWFYRQENEAWDGEETCTDITWQARQHKSVFFMADDKAF